MQPPISLSQPPRSHHGQYHPPLPLRFYRDPDRGVGRNVDDRRRLLGILRPADCAARHGFPVADDRKLRHPRAFVAGVRSDVGVGLGARAVEAATVATNVLGTCRTR